MTELYKKDLVSFETVDICRRYPKHVGIADSQSHWCGEYIQDMNLTKLGNWETNKTGTGTK